MKLTKYEHEIIIIFNSGKSDASLYTRDRVAMRRPRNLTDEQKAEIQRRIENANNKLGVSIIDYFWNLCYHNVKGIKLGREETNYRRSDEK